MRLPPSKVRARAMLWVLGMAILAVGIVPTLTMADEAQQVGLAIQFGDGGVETWCVPIQGDEIRGDDLLLLSGLDVVLDPSSGMGVTVCRIDDKGCDYPAEQCFCQCMGGGDCAYWNYFYREPGAETWTYSALGAVLRKARPGAVEAWVWGDGHSPPAEDLDFEAICGSASAAPTSQPTGFQETAPPDSAGPATATMQPTRVAVPTQTQVPATQSAASTVTVEPTQVPAEDRATGLADYWPFGLMVVALVAAGLLVRLRQA
ncbi:MAG: hypothetical protein ACP5JJ_08915 [Anaerolineae bacterium]